MKAAAAGHTTAKAPTGRPGMISRPLAALITQIGAVSRNVRPKKPAPMRRQVVDARRSGAQRHHGFPYILNPRVAVGDAGRILPLAEEIGLESPAPMADARCALA
jgi:hypothetical protein